MSDAEALKAQANKAFAAKDYVEACKLYSDAIAIDPTNHVLWSNRSASKAGQRDWAGALEDAEKCVEIAPTFAKGFARKGAALHGLRRYPEAVSAYESGLQVDAGSDVCKKGMADVKRAMEADNPLSQPDMGLGRMFADPATMAKLQNNPKTKEFMKDPAFAQRIAALQANGGRGADISQIFSDPRMLTVMGVLMGVDIDAMERDQGSNAMPPGFQGEAPAESSRPTPPREAPAPTPPKEQAEAEPIEVDEPEAEDSEVALKKDAEALKAQGNAAYKARNFDEAIGLYEKAWELYPKDVTFLTNLSAVYFEQGEYQKAIETCEKAVEEGRELRADYKTIAKAYGRIGSSYSKLDDLTNAIKFYQKSLTEHRTPDILAKLRDTEKAKADQDKQAYIDPAKAEAAREEGNTAFKAGDFATAVKHYTEAIKRLPTDPKAYNNRSAAYTKLLAFPEALKDADAAIKIDPTFIKAYIRKALVQQGMKELTAALETLQKATDADTERKASHLHTPCPISPWSRPDRAARRASARLRTMNSQADEQHTRELEQNMAKVMMEVQAERAGETDEQTYERAMRDPEVQQIMGDPLMRQILADSQQDPRALQDHMRNPMVAAKIQKLIAAGIIRTR